MLLSYQKSGLVEKKKKKKKKFWKMKNRLVGRTFISISSEKKKKKEKAKKATSRAKR